MTAANTEDLDLSALMTIDEALERFPLFRRTELFAAMRAGELRHWRKGRGRLVTERWLQDYVRRQLRGGETATWDDESRTKPDGSSLEGSGSPGTKKAGSGSGTTMTSDEEELSAGLLAQSISRKPKRSSPPSH